MDIVSQMEYPVYPGYRFRDLSQKAMSFYVQIHCLGMKLTGDYQCSVHAILSIAEITIVVGSSIDGTGNCGE